MGAVGEEQIQTQYCHVVLVPYPSQGHINPLLQFAKRLSTFPGIKATLATTNSTLPSTTSTLPNLSFASISDDSSCTTQTKPGSEQTFLSAFRAAGSASLSAIITHHSTHTPVTCVVYDAFLPWALDVAKQHGVLAASFFTNSAVVSAIFSCVHQGKLQIPLEVGDVEKVMPDLHPPFTLADLPSFLKQPESYPAYLEMKLGQFGNLDRADWVFCNSFDELELEFLGGIIPSQFPAKLIGPMVPSFYTDNTIPSDKSYGSNLWKPQRDQCRNFLDTHPPKSVIYISFGSMVSLTPTQTREIADALISHPFPFIWVIREPDHLAALPDGFLNSSDKGIVVQWCDQLEVLAHESTGCFVTHCGWNSTLEGLSLGVPMVAVPQWSDQFTDAKFLEEVWRVGVWAKVDEDGIVRKEEFGRCLREVMEDGVKREEVRKSAGKWKEKVKTALCEGGSSWRNVDEFVAGLWKKNKCDKEQNGKMVIKNGD